MKARFFRTGLGFATVSFAAIGLLLVLFLAAFAAYDKNSDSLFGLSGDMTALVISGYGPVATASMFGFRNVLFSAVGGHSRHARELPGVWVLYLVGGIGVAAAGAGLLYVSLSPPAEKANIAVPLSAGVWAATIGDTLKRFFREAIAPDGVQALHTDDMAATTRAYQR